MGEDNAIEFDDGMESTMTATATLARYEALPFNPTPERAHIVSAIMRGCCEFETVFTDYNKPCAEVCQACDACVQARAAIAFSLARPDARSWEIWKFDDAGEGELVGIIYVDKVQPGVDANCHYVFFDRKLTDKTNVLRDMIAWLMQDHEGWQGLARLSIEVPDFAFATARHACKRLGFGGGFEYRVDGKSIQIEGIRRRARRWRGHDRDVLLLGIVREC